MNLKIIIAIFSGCFVRNYGKIVNEWNVENGSYAVEKSNSSIYYPGYSNGPAPVESEEFPPDIFSKEQLLQGAVILHFIGALYSFGIVGIVCGDYFLPSIDCICCDLNLSQDVAAATFMSFATTAPELFISLIATFIVESDIGVGAVVGSGMFNILGVATVGGLAAIAPIKLDWWPLYRDSLVYVIAPIGLAVVIADGEVSIIESVCLILYYFLYFVIMFFNRDIRKKIKSCIKEIKRKKKVSRDNSAPDKPEKTTRRIPTISLTLDDNATIDNTPVTSGAHSAENKEDEEVDVDYDGSFKAYFINYEDSRSLRRVSACSTCSNKSVRSRKKSDRSLNLRKLSVQDASSPNHSQLNENLNFVVPRLNDSLEGKKPEEPGKDATTVANHVCDEDGAEEILPPNFFSLPDGTLRDKLIWLILWPASFILHYTIPDCRFDRWRNFYPLTFIMCVFWIAASSYFGTWMISVIGNTFDIPDSIMGLTFLSLGGSMPEAISTFIMARQGEGGLGFSNSLGGNTMDICLCLGLPWLIKCIIDGPVQIQSKGLQYNMIALVGGIFVLLTVATHTKFHMNKKMGIICSIFYLIFIVVSILIELKIIQVNANS